MRKYQYNFNELFFVFERKPKNDEENANIQGGLSFAVDDVDVAVVSLLSCIGRRRSFSGFS